MLTVSLGQQGVGQAISLESNLFLATNKLKG